MVIKYLSGRRIQATPPDYKIHTFTTTGNSTFEITSGSGDIEYLVIGGGGGAGGLTYVANNYYAGGGGAGGFRTNVSGQTSGGGASAESALTLSTGSYIVTVGAGGAGGSNGGYVAGNQGYDSYFDNGGSNEIRSIGGGRGGGNEATQPPTTGGSGGGGEESDGAGASGTSGQGYAGGNGNENANRGGGGGGAGSAGTATNGGNGLANPITGSTAGVLSGGIYYLAGGGASSGSGGSGGGGSGNSNNAGYGGHGSANTGSGGGSGGNGGDGGSGIVIIKYKASEITATGGTITTTTGAETKPTNVQVGSRYEETDTRKMYSYLPISKTGCKAYYNFEQTSGNLINQATTANGFADGLGSSADGTNSGATQTATGKLGNAWSFDGSNDRVELSQFNFASTDTFSVGCWYKTTQTVFSQMVGNWNSSNTGWALVDNSNSELEFRMFSTWTGSGFRTGFSPSNWNDNNWHYVVVTYDGSQTASGVTMYFDGVQQSISGDISGTVGTITYSQNAEIGARYGGGSAHYGGQLDELSIWNRVLTSDEISTLYNSGTGRIIGDDWQEIGA